MNQIHQFKPIQLGDTAPDFIAESTAGKIHFHQWMGDSWCILFSHPKDFTPVCTTELSYAAKIKYKFDERNVKIIGLSVGNLKSHEAWIEDIDKSLNEKINFPLIDDSDQHVAQLYGMIHPLVSETSTVRTVFIIDPQKKIRLTLCYPASTGRNFDEILRVIDSLQLTDTSSVATPVNWKPGEDCIILPSITDEKILKEKFPKGYKQLTPYLRMTPQPNR